MHGETMKMKFVYIVQQLYVVCGWILRILWTRKYDRI